MSSSLAPSGTYAVGATTFVLPVRPVRNIGRARVRRESGDGTEPALQLEDVVFTAFYPTDPTTFSDKKHEKGLFWMIRPLADSVRGYAHLSGITAYLLWPIILLFGYRVKIPVYVNSPPVGSAVQPSSPVSPTSEKASLGRWPLALFSHGLAGSRTTYSKLCTEMASSGKVVLSFEHRDGSGPAYRRRGGSAQDSRTQANLYIHPENVSWEGTPPDSPEELRTEQLEFRRHEIYLAYSAFLNLVQHGERGELDTLDGSEIDWKAWENVAKCDDGVLLTGHSFGGATILSILTNPPPFDTPPIPASHALALDPWVQPLPDPGPVPFEDNNRSFRNVKLLVINSEQFTLWKDHFTKLEHGVKVWTDSHLLTLVRSKHVSFSDFPLIAPPPFRDSNASLYLSQICSLSIAFLDDHLKETLAEMKTRKMEMEWVQPPVRWWQRKRPISTNEQNLGQRQLIGEPGDVIVHVLT